MNPWLLFFLGWSGLALAFALLWEFQRRRGDAGVVDIAWTFGVGLLGAVFAAAVVGGVTERKLVVALLASLWAARLGAYIWQRVLRLPEDGRYQTLKAQWGERAQAKLFGFYQLQALAAALFALPMLAAGRNPQPWGNFDWLAVAVWLIAVLGEGVADHQLARFRARPENKGKVCRDGLWYYSRHPNYFFEWIHWWAYVLLAVGTPWGWITVLAPIAMLYLVLRVTGIPPTERQALRSRPESYRRYQQTTSPFFPWPPRPDGDVI